MTVIDPPSPTPSPSPAAPAGLSLPYLTASPAVIVDDATVTIGSRTTLTAVRLAIPAGALVAIAGGSGAGKTTLLEVMAGLRRPTRGQVLVGRDRRPAPSIAGSGRVGVVPQDDIIHRDLPLRRTLLHAARLRLAGATRPETEALVSEVLARLGLRDRADVPVGALSGGQRKRASIAVELLTRPEVLFLDEPTSGLDPVSAAEVLAVLRSLTDTGMTVVMTTHHPAEVARADHAVFLGPRGRVCFAGPPDAAYAHFGVADLSAVYPLIAPSDPDGWAERWAARPAASVPIDGPAPAGAAAERPDARRSGPTRRRQWVVLASRSAEVMVRNRLTLAILVGSPALVIAMMALLFPAGAFAAAAGRAAGAAAMGPPQTIFWMAFSAFFFGLTYGLLQIVTERAVLHRERFAGMSPTAYVAAKVAVLLPVLATVVVALLAVLRGLDRLPAADWSTYAELAVTLVLAATAGLAIGLAASAAVADPAQATLALPMVCFPQVLFAGAVVPADQMAGAGAGLSLGMATRWAFDSLGRTLELAPDLNHPYAEAFTGPVEAGWIGLATITVVAATVAVLLVRRTGRSRPSAPPLRSTVPSTARAVRR